MKTRWIGIACGVACFTACGPEKPTKAKAKPLDPPEIFLIEAEASTITGETTGDPMASGNTAVLLKTGNGLSQFACAVVSTKKPLTVWLRHKGGPVGMKISGSDQRVDSRSNSIQEQYIWTSFGEMEVSEDPRQIVFTGNSETNETVAIDCVLFADGNVEDKDALLTPLPPVSIGQPADEFRTAPAVWGINFVSGNKSETFSETDLENLAYLAPAFIRIQADGLLDSENRKWDEDKIRKTIQSLLELQKAADIMVSLPNWPAWMDADNDGFLDENSKDGYAELIARFAQIIWDFPEAHARVLFEITNGQDKRYYSDQIAEKKPHRVAELARIYLLTASRIRTIAPSARIGGPSAMDIGNMFFHEQFIAITAPELDFYSVHFHTGDSKNDPGSQIKEIKDILHKNSLGRYIPLSINEVHKSAENLEPVTSSAVRSASFVLAAFNAGTDSIASWNGDEQAQEDQIRPVSDIYHILNSEFSGPCAILNTDDANLLTALGTEDGNRMLFVHRGFRNRTLTLPEGEWTGWILENGSDAPREFSVTEETELPGTCVLFLEK